MSFINGIKGAMAGAERARHARVSREASAPVVVPESHKYCVTCGHQGEPEKDTPGSIWIEVILWLCFLIPGLIYSVWRLNRRHEVCRACGSKELIPHDSPKAVAQKRAMSAS